MGQCGCADINIQYKFKGPENTFYLLAVYDSCPNCDAPAGHILYKMTEEECKTWGVEDMPCIEPCYEGDFLAIIHPRILREMILKSRGLNEDSDLAYDLEDSFSECFREAVWASKKDMEEGS